MNKEIIKNAIAHLNGYVMLLEVKNIPTLAVKETIEKLRELEE